jgi:hypothetical protein
LQLRADCLSGATVALHQVHLVHKLLETAESVATSRLAVAADLVVV